MAPSTIKTDVIDADAHVVESEQAWDYLEASEEKYRPTLKPSPENPHRQNWFLDDGNLKPRSSSPNERQSAAHFERFGREVATPVEAREVSDVRQRLRHMDELGIDVRVLYNSLWLTPLTRRPDAEIALCWSWNRWLADVAKKSKGRLRYSCVVPGMDIGEAVAQIKFAKEGQICGLLWSAPQGLDRIRRQF